MGIDLTEEQTRARAEKCGFFGKRTMGGVKKLDQEDMDRINREAKGG